MTRWIRSFDFPDVGWLQLSVNDPDGAELAAREIAQRPGDRARQYAEAVYPELKVIWENMRKREAAPVVLYVPLVPQGAPPLVPASAYVEGALCAPAERTVEAVLDQVRRPQPYRHGRPEITVLELPAGPACRLHELMLEDKGDDGRRFVIEHVDYFFLPPVFPEVLFKLSVNWASPAVGPEMVDIADAMAATLRISPEQEGGGARAQGEQDLLAEGAREPR
ncbi:hypothetical protein E1265_02340 [Streptomyces sp. 8K308]|uniref:hypothetical protein n=1 Tax=Streptomyces sp. 8K308 TaxID=2530388 RepID=UPI00104511FD|nr:hypothetical protein [Streptomyces sp. 8K308]TDC27138.1 hypothetical protein E1265_02340 [Streptomyces sp. 8K308]